ncbi:hypothetical protein AVEN_16080-1 [Araneus ventricosus]|uniref:Uncharacterized protein n=1 Tax=Araneus ventricosus TaxID=182803 RepID=A0A4Y2SMV5_ARAVE|nr:hypothetical protein AVEN_16080-1 [Araneus ventricosus]
MALPSPVASENQAAENKKGRRGGMDDVGLVSQDQGVYSGTPGWVGVPGLMSGTQPNRGYQNRPRKHEMKRRDDLKDDIRCYPYHITNYNCFNCT